MRTCQCASNWQNSCAHSNSYYFDKNGNVPLRPTTTLESALRSRRFNLHDYEFRHQAVAGTRCTPLWRGRVRNSINDVNRRGG